MDTIKFFKERKRMCDAILENCHECPMSSNNNNYGLICGIFCEKHPEEAVGIVEQWSNEHPITTNIDMFIRVFGHVENNILSLTWWQEEYKKPNEC